MIVLSLSGGLPRHHHRRGYHTSHNPNTFHLSFFLLSFIISNSALATSIMRLLNTTTIKLHEFYGTDIPYYAILSHRWGINEVTFQDLQQGRGPEMAGWAKIVGCCAQALKEGWDYVWIDSCCIDKSSSAELSEAINSMFQWYEDSQVCYAYLDDVPLGEEDHERENSAFRNSKWFTRGWTLQELLAPQTVVFFNHGWAEIGTRTSFGKLVSSITNIGEIHLKGFESASTAQKFSWASRRQTLRIEDTAYCLMGLFGVNMPLLYGEGSKAFMRLQLEIIKVSDDDSIFAWVQESAGEYHTVTGLLADSPSAFQQSCNISTANWSRFRLTSPYSMTNHGLNISLMLIPAAEAAQKSVQLLRHEMSPYDFGSDQFLAPLSCYTWSKPLGKEQHREKNHVLLHFGRYTEANGRKGYIRIFSNRLHHLSSTDIPQKGKMEQILVPQPAARNKKTPGRGISKLAISSNHFLCNEFAISSITELTGIDFNREYLRMEKWHPSNSNAHDRTLVLKLGINCMALVEFKSRSSSVEIQDTFILKIHRPGYDLLSIGLILFFPNSKSLGELFFPQAWGLKWDTSSDWAMITLPSGLVITAALRTRLRDGELVYAVDVDTSPSSSMDQSSGREKRVAKGVSPSCNKCCAHQIRA